MVENIDYLLEQEFDIGGCWLIKCGHLRLWLSCQTSYISYVAQYVSEYEERMSREELSALPLLDDVEWQSVATCENSLRIQPKYTDLPLVLRPATPFSVIAGQKITLLLEIPVVLEFIDKNDNALFSVPTETLSKTWFGLPTKGELCYSLKTAAKTDLREWRDSFTKVKLKLNVHNQSNEILNLLRMQLAMGALPIYDDSKGLFTKEASISYKGHEKWGGWTFKEVVLADGLSKRVLKEAGKTSGVFFKTIDMIKSSVSVG